MISPFSGNADKEHGPLKYNNDVIKILYQLPHSEQPEVILTNFSLPLSLNLAEFADIQEIILQF